MGGSLIKNRSDHLHRPPGGRPDLRASLMPPTPLLLVHCGVPRDRFWGTLEFLRGPFWAILGFIWGLFGPSGRPFRRRFLDVFFENPRFDAPSAVSGRLRRRLRRRNADFQNYTAEEPHHFYPGRPNRREHEWIPSLSSAIRVPAAIADPQSSPRRGGHPSGGASPAS